MAYANQDSMKRQKALIDAALARLLPENKVVRVVPFSQEETGMCDGHSIELTDEVYIEVMLLPQFPLDSHCYVYKDVTKIAGSIPVDAALEFAINTLGWD